MNTALIRICGRLALIPPILCLLLLAPMSKADFCDVRPAPSDYTNAVAVGTWCGKAVEERGVAIGDNTAFLPRASSQQKVVISAKQEIQSRYPSYIKPDANVVSILSTEGVDGLLWSNDVAFLSYCGLATNCFTATPYFTCQNPEASNGWRMARACLTNMVKTTCYSWTLYTDCLETEAWKANASGWFTNATGARQAAERLWRHAGFYPPYEDLPWRYSESARTTSSNWCNTLSSSYNYIGYQLVTTNIGHSAEVYMLCGPVSENLHEIHIYGYPTNYADAVFDVQGLNPATIQTNWVNVTNFPESFASGNDMLIGLIGDTAHDPGKPVWCSDAAVNTVSTRGFRVLEGSTIMVWTGVNGFQYK